MTKIQPTDLKVFNVVVQYDFYIVAHNQEEAGDAILGAIRGGETPSEIITYLVKNLRDIRMSWREEKPFVAGEVEDNEWKEFEGKTTGQIYAKLSSP